ncbi:MAG: hypothetical protein D4R84_01315 [Rhodocyclaceae bacterium]|nr:MAG: hypothetical protein D4R84_01315 [Rhodocyclaceae bacterium]
MAEYRGNLYIFVDEFEADAIATTSRERDDVFGLRDPGEMIWYLNGWAIGKTARGQYCARTSTSKLRTFGTYAEAMDFARKKRKSRPTERFHLVYEVDGRKSLVTSLEQILQADGQLTGPEHRMLHGLAEHPELDTLTERVGMIVASNALELLRTLTNEGESAARERFSTATYQRLWQVLQEAALVQGKLLSETH